MSEPAIELDALTVRYGSFTAVDGMTLSIRRGELFGLLGPNGAGKSSTLRVLTGQRRPAGGSARVLGLDVVRDWEAIKPNIGFVPDRENHFDEFTGRANLEFFAGLYGVPRDRASAELERVELAEAADLPVSGYSLGMKRKLLLARARLHAPTVLYLDEPTANLDVHSAGVVHRLLRDHVAAGGAAVITTHNMKEVEQICDRVAVLCRGKLVVCDTPLSIRRRHHERKADVVTHDNRRLEFDLDADADALAELVRERRVASLQTREFDFHAAFLKLTGHEYA